MVERGAVFNQLPEELTERILAHLPISTIFRCRCVCKHWNKLLNTNSFLESWGEFSPKDVWFLVYHTRRTVAAYSPRSGWWNNLPLFDRCSLDSSQVLLLASSGGFLCFRNRNSDYPTLIVCNPVTRTHRVLPEMPQIRYIDIVGMVADRVSGSYTILVTGTPEPTCNESITEVYDSRTQRWEQHCRSQQEFLQFWYEVHAIWHDGFFYCLATPLNTSQGYRLIAYDMKKREWMDLNVKMPSGDLRCPSLLICRGKLLLAGKIVEDYLIRSICIWELENLKWVKVVEMPDEVLKKIHSPHSVLIQCQGHGDLLCFSTHRGWQSIIYDLSERAWNWLPENDVSKSQAMGRNNLVGLPYEPSLCARV
ncbi:F-box/kelch-repeat protein At5g15710-like [Telopea speciosissima]|uniref:F-box/kelch-repeat protein At5g15710-like n=1 Tax=Telopea speciosissima TaxID=54955 RepID=UPI001CC3AD43|nr:F-box/kelch-repeat protein At5g15710-like [Telopea speciosissima]